jgi:hypothetical protein
MEYILLLLLPPHTLAVTVYSAPGTVEEDLFIFYDTIQGPRAPVVKPGRVTQA